MYQIPLVCHLLLSQKRFNSLTILWGKPMRYVQANIHYSLLVIKYVITCCLSYTQATLELKNISAVSRQLRLVPLKSAYFKVAPSACPTANGVVAPGLCASYTISFTPDSLENYQTDLTVNHNTHSTQRLVRFFLNV